MHRRNVVRAFAAAPLILLAGCPAPLQAVDQISATNQGDIHVATVVSGLSHPWSLEFLPDGSMLVTERAGRLLHIGTDNVISAPIAGVPQVDNRGQGGLLDIALDPDFATNRTIYLSFSEPGPNGTNGTAVLRAVLSPDNASLSDQQVIFQQNPKVDSIRHYGSRLVFDNDGHLFVTLGERSDTAYRDQAQDLSSHLGKIVRINPTGSIPQDNPFLSTPGALPEIWSYGNRNVQAAAIHPPSGMLWEIEHGPRGGDELNVIQPGGNYGWPLISYGVNYDGTPVGTGESAMPGMIEPLYTWTPVIAPSGMMFYSGTAFPEWQGDLFVGGLRSTALVRLELSSNGGILREERLLEDVGARIRDVREGPDGAIYVITDEDNGEVIRISPAGP